MNTLLLSSTIIVVTLTMRIEARGFFACPKHSFYQNCRDLCPKRCHVPKEVGCSNECIPGCQCTPGYELNYRGQCVKTQDCDRKPLPLPTAPPLMECPLGSHYQTCRDRCPKRCNLSRPTICDHTCVPGCTCDPGFELNKYGRCVLPQQCEPPNQDPHQPENNSNEGLQCDDEIYADITVHIHGKNYQHSHHHSKPTDGVIKKLNVLIG